ncbi:VWA domain-containing protein [Fuchsiella alkaliacetigena]|uniref:VWA domain-containing protein n=1 Tax=Fuchsiella alkaliacetigena TaxID=957042 RepID=UPI002009F080|nr:VWA domain-containing protein [Fuchsiella alkaliacetigena]MCK8825789.1 VWA domain-containing protein [Fuchsiella alkaliacetigena]
MLNKFKNLANPKIIPFKLVIKGIKSWIDNKYREKVVPIEGSVLYSDLLGGVEHSGIYIGDNQISNIKSGGIAEGVVKKSSPRNFTKRSLMHKKIYVSCDKNGAVGDREVSQGAKDHIGDRSFYGLVFNNCHSFSSKCLDYSKQNYTFNSTFELRDIDETWEPTVKLLKQKAKKKLGATKWKLWDWKNQSESSSEQKVSKPNLAEIKEFFKQIPLNPENIKVIQSQLEESKAYKEEIVDENIPSEAINLINGFSETLKKIDNKYQETKEFINLVGRGYSYKELVELDQDFASLAKEMKENRKVLEVVEKLGRNYISETEKKQPKINKRGKSEVFGLHRSNDLVRLLPSELVNFEDEELEYLFYSKFLEHTLLTYELVSKTREEKEELKKGPVIACLDTSGSMSGLPILKAKALLLSISEILEEENRSLYILLFGSAGEIKELHIKKKEQSAKILHFLKQGFGGGTDFETPLKRGVKIIEDQEEYNKADILMITDGLCKVTDDFTKYLSKKKLRVGFNVYTVICATELDGDDFSDEIISI